jgi:hypothetical protein
MISTTNKTNVWSLWLGRALWVGIIQDYVMGVPALLWPNETLSFFRQPLSADPVMVSFATSVLLVLGALYIPAAIDPYRFPLVTWLSVLARPPGVYFFLKLYPGQYTLFGIIDSVLSVVQLSLACLAFFAVRNTGNERVVTSDDPKSQSPYGYFGASFNQIRSILWSDPYSRLPHYFGAGPFRLLRLLNDSSRNLSDKRDLLPRFSKLIHANGICHSGVWEITSPTPYTGFFAQGAKGLVIARLSVAGLTVSSGSRRAFGIAGKIFPTTDPDEVVYPGNFVTVSHLSGLRTEYIVDIEVTNRPTIGLDPFANLVNRVLFRLVDTRPGFRQLHPISTLGIRSGQKPVTPDLLLLKIADGTPRVKAPDFREELRVRNYPDHKLVFDICVRNIDEQAWNRIGSLRFDDDVASESGDKRLHFWIPRDISATKPRA